MCSDSDSGKIRGTSRLKLSAEEPVAVSSVDCCGLGQTLRGHNRVMVSCTSKRVRATEKREEVVGMVLEDRNVRARRRSVRSRSTGRRPPSTRAPSSRCGTTYPRARGARSSDTGRRRSRRLESSASWRPSRREWMKTTGAGEATRTAAASASSVRVGSPWTNQTRLSDREHDRVADEQARDPRSRVRRRRPRRRARAEERRSQAPAPGSSCFTSASGERHETCPEREEVDAVADPRRVPRLRATRTP